MGRVFFHYKLYWGIFNSKTGMPACLVFLKKLNTAIKRKQFSGTRLTASITN